MNYYDILSIIRLRNSLIIRCQTITRQKKGGDLFQFPPLKQFPLSFGNRMPVK